ncbi:amino acid adenylation domain protein [Actinobacteria bacterium OK074]|nr:amino acid adenylation domain protein [Actinobacteria bacterium OK074]
MTDVPESATAPFPLTDLQEAYLVGMSRLIELGGFRPNYYVELEVTDLDPARAEAALHRLVQRHEQLRTVVLAEGGQRVLARPKPYRPPVVDLTRVSPKERDEALRSTRTRMRDEGVDPTRWPLFEVCVHRTGPRHTRVHIALSLLLLDGRGIRRLVREWQELYRDPAAVPPSAGVTYREARLALLADEDTDAHREHRRYWSARLDTLPGPPALPLAVPLGQIDPVRFTRRSCRIAPERWRRLRTEFGRRRVLPTSALLHVFAEVLGAWATDPHFSVNVLHQTWAAGHPEWSATVGQFGATLPLETDLGGDADFWARGQRVQRQLWKDLPHAGVSAVRVMRESATRRGWTSRAALPYVFTSMLASGPDSPPGAERAVLPCRIVDSALRTPQVLIDNQVQDTPDGGVECVWDVVDDAFPPGLPDAMFDAYRELLESLAGRGGDDALPEPVPGGHRALVERVNRTAVPLPPERLEDGFLRRAAAGPDAVALVTPDREMTYGELERASRALARELRERGVGREDVVPVVMSKGWEQVVAVLGVLRAGAAYCPVDAALPAERIRHLIGACTVAFALTRREGGSVPGAVAMPVDENAEATEDTGATGDAGPGHLPDRPGGASDLAYVIHTSGSTGQPKGVEIEHRGAVNTILDVNRRIGLGPADRVFGISSLSFDLSVWDVFGTLAAGAALVLPEATPRPDPVGWAGLARRCGVTVWNSVPALAEMLVEVVARLPEPESEPDPPPVRAFLLSGDWIPPALAARLRGTWPGVRIVAMGGATEASIWSNAYEVGEIDPAWRGVPYGRPLANQTMRILDHRMAVRPPWAVGRIHIGGAGLARGYRGDPERTAERFVRHPRTGERLYWTGDLGRYWPDGTIEFLGREDRQLKIHGFRVEPGEVEAVLRGHPAVSDCVVCAEGVPGGARRLVAIAVPGQPDPPDAAALLDHLRARLPHYMVPGRLHLVPTLPLTANGKVDVAAALAAVSAAPRARGGASATDRAAEPEGADDRQVKQLSELWAELLAVARVGPDDDFFALGGNSLLALRLVNRVRTELGVDLPFGRIFETPTVRTLAAAVRRGERDTAGVVTLAEGTGPELFLFHPVGGSVAAYVPLARAWGGPVRAFQSRALTDRSGGAPPADLAGMAAGYRRELQRLVPNGPCVLGGWSMGGVLAHEVARQLAERGRRAYPFLIDSDPRHRAPATEAARHLEFLRDLAGGRLSETADTALSAAGPGELARLGRDLAVAARLLPPEVGTAEYARLAAVHAANLAALAGHRPGRFDGPALLLAAGQTDRPDPVPAWRAVCRDLTARVWPCDHYSIIAGSRPTAVAGEVRAWLAGLGVRTDLPPTPAEKEEIS